MAYYVVNPKKGLSLEIQKAIIHHFAKQDKATITQEFVETDIEKRTKLRKTINYCQKNNATLIIAKLNILSLNVDLIFDVKKKLGDNFQSCDLPTSDRLTLSVAIGI